MVESLELDDVELYLVHAGAEIDSMQGETRSLTHVISYSSCPTA